jgi:hypothetical protein
MKKIILILLFVPLTGFSNDQTEVKTAPTLSQECRRNTNTKEESKDCLAIEKNKEAQQNFRNFQENNHNQQFTE